MRRFDTVADLPQRTVEQRSTKKRYRREGAKWTRSGCLTCKRRRKRCDEAKPSCHGCARLGLACEGYGSMWAAPLGVADHGFTHSKPPKQRTTRATPGPSARSCLSTPGQSPSTDISICSPRPMYSPASITSPLTQYDGPERQDDCSQNSTMSNNAQLVLESPSPSRLISHLSNLDTHYLQYHMEKGSKLLANLETDENPLRSLLIPRALSSPLLMNALCALSAIHFSNRTHYSWAAENEGANYYIDTMRGLRFALMTCQPKEIPDDAILAVALLCKYEIVQGSVKQWAVHLDALQTMIITRGGLTDTDEDTADFIRGIFVYANNMSKITNRRKIKPSISGLDTMITRKLDIYIGYTEDILKICARISDLPQLNADPLALSLEISTIDTLLRIWTHTKTEYIIPRGITEATLSRLRLVAESFRDAAYLYLHSVLKRLTSSPPAVSESASNLSLPMDSTWPKIISISKQNVLTSLLHRLEQNPIDTNCEFSALTFPLFIAGCETTSRADRGFILQMLGKLELNFGIRNVKRAKEVLGVVWEGEDGKEGGKGRHWIEVLEGLGWDLILA
ncbi:fungal-specific transcription factor domain-containing protein [Aspergillus karnatakaensis]|uniref:Zn(II)2Cys6 transcription factor n=1 Tax=Aspergillus karnatakaensis TaxID=1810916 RepID=UPI003CCCB9D9